VGLKLKNMQNILLFANNMARFLIIMGLVSLINGIPVYYLWNHYLVNAINGINHITYIQASGLFFLCTLLFKSSIFNIDESDETEN
jgi:hypothetical protein